jgi:hypothetical protein
MGGFVRTKNGLVILCPTTSSFFLLFDTSGDESGILAT